VALTAITSIPLPSFYRGLLLLCNAEFMGRYPGRTAAIGIYVASKAKGTQVENQSV